MRIISQLAMEKASQAWCMPETSKTKMDVKLACEFAKILDSEMWIPHLGCATTKQLFEELMARSDLDCRPTVAENKKHEGD